MQKLAIKFRCLVAVLISLIVLTAATAQTLPTDLYSGLKWRLIGPFRGGRVVAVSGIAGNPTTFYFGSVGGGVWKTTDAGMVWKPIFDAQPIASIGALTVAPSDPKIIYAGTGESDIRSNLSSGDGVYKSSDGGQTWTNIGLRDTRQISRIVIDPQNPNIVYVGALGHAYAPDNERGVYKSTDGGATWTKVLDQGPDIGVSDLAIAADESKLLFATTWRTRRPPWSTYGPLDGPGGGLFRSQDSGQSWSRVAGNGLPEGDWGRTGVAVSPSGKRVYALISASKKPGLYRSDDGGSTWTLQNEDHRLTSRAWYFGNITVDPNNPDVFYVPNVALYRSEDGGKTISIVRGAPGGDDYHQIWVDPKDSSRMILGTDQGATISLDYGQTWSSWYNQPTAQFYHVITDDQFPYVVYGTEQDSGSAAVRSRSDSGLITPRDWFPAGGSESGYIAPDPNDPNIVYLSATYGGVSRFNLRTSFSQDITPWPLPNFLVDINTRKYRDPWTPVLLFSPVDKKTLYLGTQYVMKTLDGGLHWDIISPDLTGSTLHPGDKKPDGPPTVENAKQRGYGVAYTIAPSSLNGNILWAGTDTGLIHLTQDGGKNWKDVTPKGVGDWSKISLIEASHFDLAEAYAAVDRHRLDDQKPYLYRTRDYGATWQLITDGIGASSFLRAVREDPQTRGLLFAGTELGAYVSFDDGDHWQSLQLNLPTVSIHDLTIHRDDLVVATHGRAFWILDNITPLRQVHDALNAGPWLFEPATAIRIDNDSFLGSPLPPEEPTANNPPNGAMIDYYLKNTASHIKLDIFDAKHNLVNSFSSDDPKEQKHLARPIAERWFPKPEILETTPGMHRFVWNLTWGGEAADQLSESDYRPPRPPRAVPGTYQLRLTVDGKTLAQPLKIAMDPRSAATARDLEQQLQLGRQIFVEAMNSRQILAEVRSVQKQLSDLEQMLGGGHADLKSAVSQLESEIQKVSVGSEDPSNKVVGLENASKGLTSALAVIESGDRAVPSQAIALYEESSQALKLRIADWNHVKTNWLPQLNQHLRQGNIAPIVIGEIVEEVDEG
ncbi:MAG TPA: hypothetical protein VNZ03_09900 [Terriglobales bacterium]|nr:hypothetical protein [Terriglobales bacterium]